MMSDYKKGIKMIRHAYGIKLNCIQAGVFMLTGLLLFFMGEMGNFGLMGGFFWISIGIIPSQLIHSLNVANIVQSSPMKKKLQTAVPVIVNLMSMIVVYLAEILLCGIIIWKNPERTAEMGGSLVALAGMMALVLMYLGVCYKYFVVATLCLVPIMVIWMRGGLDGWIYLRDILGGWSIPFGPAVLVGFGILAAGSLAEYLLSLLFYKRPMSKRAQAVPLRKEL